MRPIDADALKNMRFSCGMYDDNYVVYAPIREVMENIDKAPTIGGWINNYEWICPACGTSILIKTFKQSKAIGMPLSVCPVCGKEVLYGKAD